MGKRNKVPNEIPYNLSLRETFDRIKEIFKLKDLKMLLYLDIRHSFIATNYELVYGVDIMAKFIGIAENNISFNTCAKVEGITIFRNFDGSYFAKTEYAFSSPNYLNDEQVKQLMNTKITDYFHKTAYILYQMTNQRYHQTGYLGYKLPSYLDINSMQCLTKVYGIDINLINKLEALSISADSNLKFKDFLINTNGEVIENLRNDYKNKLIIIE